VSREDIELAESELRELNLEEENIDVLIAQMQAEIGEMSRQSDYEHYAYVTEQDILMMNHRDEAEEM